MIHFKGLTLSLLPVLLASMLVAQSKAQASSPSQPGNVQAKGDTADLPPLEISPKDVTFAAGSGSLKFTVSPANVKVRWTLEGEAPLGTVSALSGIYVAPIIMPKEHTVFLVATAQDGSGRVAKTRLFLLKVQYNVGQMDLAMPEIFAKRGQKVNVKFLVSEVETPFATFRITPFSAFQLDLIYPASVAAPDIADPANPLEVATPLFHEPLKSMNLTSPGIIRVGAANQQNVRSEGILVSIPLVIKGDAPLGAYPLQLNYGMFSDADGLEFVPIKVNTHDNNGRLTIVSSLCGDADLNGTVDVADALLALQSTIGLKELTTEQRLVADTNGNGTVTIGDVVKILRVAVHLDVGCSASPASS